MDLKITLCSKNIFFLISFTIQEVNFSQTYVFNFVFVMHNGHSTITLLFNIALEILGWMMS